MFKISYFPLTFMLSEKKKIPLKIWLEEMGYKKTFAEGGNWCLIVGEGSKMFQKSGYFIRKWCRKNGWGVDH